MRRGYFVEGHGGAQFALPGADERLRAFRAPDAGAQALVLAASDPANAWGALLEWPAPAGGDARPQRSGGRAGRAPRRSAARLARARRPRAADLRSRCRKPCASSRGRSGALVDAGDRRALLVSTVDGVAAADSPVAGTFVAAGFASTSRGLLKRRSGAAAHGAEVELAR